MLILLLIYILIGFLNIILKANTIKDIIKNNNVSNHVLILGLLAIIFAWPLVIMKYGK